MASPYSPTASEISEFAECFPPPKPKGFRINAKKFFVTYPQCGDLSKDMVLQFFKNKGHICEYVIGEEEHKDGGRHVHAAIHFSNKYNLTTQDGFDINGYHPNVQAAKSFANVKTYCKKDGNFIEDVALELTPEKFRERAADLEAYQDHMKQIAKKPVKWPIKLPDGKDYTPVGKRRNVWMIAPPDWGKTTWVMNTFDGSKVYMRPNDNKYPFERYKGEEVIIYDDVYPSQEEFLNVCNLHFNDMHVYGNTRYKSVMWPNKIDLTVIVLSNICPNYNNMAAFDARFIVIDLTNL